MAGFTTGNTSNLTRTLLWSREIKGLLLDDLNAMKFVRIIQDFPDGNVINIPSIGEAETADFNENQAIKYNAMATGNFQFSFDNYKYSANSISEKFKRDSYYSPEVEAAFVPREHRALMEAVEANIFAKANAGQTASDPNVINNAQHRFVGSGTAGALALTDFPHALYSLTKANVPLNNLCAVVDPSVAYTLQTLPNSINLLSPMPMYSEMQQRGLVTGFKFAFNYFGFDIYVSNYLPVVASETVNSVTVTNGVVNMFFSSTPGETLPWIGGFRQMPTVYSKFNMDLQQTEYATFAEWGFALFRPENMVTILTPKPSNL